MKKVIVSWSGGKDSALAYYRLQLDTQYEIAGLLTIVFKYDDGKYYIGMHMIDIELIKLQAKLIDVKLHIIEYSDKESYNIKMLEFLTYCKSKSIVNIAFGDIHLRDLRTAREDKLVAVGMNAIFPLWGNDAQDVLLEFTNNGFKAVIVNVDNNYIDKSVLGAQLTLGLVSQFNIDLCGENGEYHSLVYDAPMFKQPLQFQLTDIIQIDAQGRYFSIISQINAEKV